MASLTSTLYRLARMSADFRAASRGPSAVGKRLVRKQIGRAWGRSGIPRFPRRANPRRRTISALSPGLSPGHNPVDMPPDPKYVVFDGDALDGTVYRIVAQCPPTRDDFRSYADLGRAFPTHQFFRATGVSMHLTRGHADAANRRFKLGAAIAELDARDNRVLWAVTDAPHGHITVWAPPDALLGFVTDCT